jgi:signal transduction histidine kinase
MDNPLLAQFLREGKRRKFPGSGETTEISWYCPTVARKIQAAAVVPLQFDGNVVGGMWIGYFEQQRLAPGQMQGLGYLADQVIIALQQATMAAQLQSAATVEERTRIAREMHDGLSQILGYLGLQVQTIESFVSQGDQERALAELKRTRGNVKAAHADVRDNILSLRTTLSGQTGLVPALAGYIRGFGLQTGLDVQLVDETDGEPGLSPLAEVQLVRVIQEALTNVRKHAAAQRVAVRLWVEDGHFWASVSDDGQGFASDEPGNGSSFGLETMRERMESVHGCLEIHSTPGQGTDVRLCVPRLISEGRYGQTTATLRPHR